MDNFQLSLFFFKKPANPIVDIRSIAVYLNIYLTIYIYSCFVPWVGFFIASRDVYLVLRDEDGTLV